jgi:dienelactone hydrolase
MPRRLAPLLLTVLTLALAGCAGGPPPQRPWAEVARQALNLALASIDVQGRRVHITRSAGAPAASPVVVYLPGLGQGGDTGQRWAAAWAQAGYTVLAVQPLEADAAAWRSELSRTGEFRALGQLHYGDTMRAERLAMLRRLRAALQAAQPGLDWTRAALAGYETGAQTALDARADGWQAVIAISPPPMAAPPDGAPTLIVTSDLDHDPLGLIARPAERRQAFDTLAAGRGWLLQLAGVSHAGLAGTLAPEPWQAQDRHELRAPRLAPGRGEPAPPGGSPTGLRSGSASEAAQARLGAALRDTTAFLHAQLSGRPLDAPGLRPR